MKTGFFDLDDLISLDKGDLMIVGGRPSMGKTTFALNIAGQVAENGRKVLIFSFELSKKEIKNRIFASKHWVDINKIRNKTLDKEKQELFEKMNLEDLNIYVEDEPNLSLDNIEEICIKEKQKKDIDLVIIDYAQLISVPEYKNSANEIASRLKALANKLEIPIICTSQISSKVDRRMDKRPKLTDFEFSKELVDKADIVLLLYRDEYYDPDTELRNIAEVIVAKNKVNKIGNIQLVYLSRYERFANLDK